MSRRTTAKKRLAVPDPIYNSRLVSMLTVRILQQGKKHLAQRIIYQALDIIKERTGEDALTILENAIRKVTPLVEVKAKRIGGSTYQVPLEVRAFRGTNLALRWITKYSKERSGKSMAMKLANELPIWEMSAAATSPALAAWPHPSRRPARSSVPCRTWSAQSCLRPP